MLVNARNNPVIQPSHRADLDPTTAAASALSSGFIQNAQAAATATSAPGTQNAADKIADNLNAAFAKTRVHLQAAVPNVAAPATLTATAPTTRTAPAAIASNDSNATKEFKDYMNKPVAQRIREQLLKEQGLTEDSLKSLSPEKQKGIEDKIAERLKLEFNAKTADNQANPVDQQVAGAFLATK
ncbi:hypothetical protein [Pseudomonas batumici]|uniref:Uncharacterized protein n=1 Tax=Pseudomonas batumici TaxID=226910 RepID=A0A0C2EU10_9PSED|nr:hypothetical protein [Pseudomonas batumici]KIH82078.1 hypothetical protein UCMB321_4079 [Pseudomonas batumici]